MASQRDKAVASVEKAGLEQASMANDAARGNLTDNVKAINKKMMSNGDETAKTSMIINNSKSTEEGDDQTALLAERCGIQFSKKVPTTEFKLFPLLPREIQTIVWVEYMNKPSVHIFKIAKQLTGDGRWSIKLHPYPRGRDESYYRWWKQLIHVGHGISEGIRRALFPFGSIPMPRTGAVIKSQTDLVILDLNRAPAAIPIEWRQHNKKANSLPMDMAEIRNTFQGIRNLGIYFMRIYGLAKLPNNPFRCRCPRTIAEPFGPHGELYMCPVSLAAFLDCFRNLDTFYLVLKTSSQSFPDRQDLRTYLMHLMPDVFSPTGRLPCTATKWCCNEKVLEAVRKEVDVFHTTKRLLVEFHSKGPEYAAGWDEFHSKGPECAAGWDDYRFSKEAIKVAKLTAEAFTGGDDDEFYTNSEQRANVKVKVLCHT